MTILRVSIWFDGDIGPASIEYFRKSKIKNSSLSFVKVNDRLTEEAFHNFPNLRRVEIEVVD